MNKRCNRIEQVGNKLLAIHNLSDWKLMVLKLPDDYFHVAGACVPSSKMIVFNQLWEQFMPMKEIRNIILHEIAHALGGEGHGKKWKKFATLLNISTEKYFIPKRLLEKNK
jgi:hypothetical protein